MLDVGCGHGHALRAFQKEGVDVEGIGFDQEAEQARAQGFTIHEQDMSFLTLEPESYDLVWCRHVLEHSVFPFFTLGEMHRLIKPNGGIYVEVPAPETACRHETNPNHYCVMGKTAWASLMQRAGFVKIAFYEIDFTVPAGPDKYLAFHARKG